MALRNVFKAELGARKMGMITSVIGDQEKGALEARRLKKIKPKYSEKESKDMQKIWQRQSSMFPCRRFVAKVAIINPIGKIAPGYTPVLHCHNAQVPVKITSVKEIVERKNRVQETNKKYKESPLKKYQK